MNVSFSGATIPNPSIRAASVKARFGNAGGGLGNPNPPPVHLVHPTPWWKKLLAGLGFVGAVGGTAVGVHAYDNSQHQPAVSHSDDNDERTDNPGSHSQTSLPHSDEHPTQAPHQNTPAFNARGLTRGFILTCGDGHQPSVDGNQGRVFAGDHNCIEHPDTVDVDPGNGGANYALPQGARFYCEPTPEGAGRRLTSSSPCTLLHPDTQIAPGAASYWTVE